MDTYRATVNLPGARFGSEWLVDADRPENQLLIERGYFVKVDGPDEQATPVVEEQPVEDAPESAQEPPGDDETPEADSSTLEATRAAEGELKARDAGEA